MCECGRCSYIKRKGWAITWGIALIIPAGIIYLINYGIFGDPAYLLKDFLSSVAFVPIFYLISTVVIDRFLSSRDKQYMLDRLNVVIGAFYTECGMDLIKMSFVFLSGFETANSKLSGISSWRENDFAEIGGFIQKLDYQVDSRKGSLQDLKVYLLSKRDFILGMMQNPNLMEHQTFTDMMLALFHLYEELAGRPQLSDLPESDMDHLSGDMKRAHKLIIIEWTSYIKHLKRDYPYLFSLTARKNPFNSEVNIVVSGT